MSTSIIELISAYAEAKKLADAAEVRSDNLFTDADRPTFPCVRPQELGWPYRHYTNSRDITDVEELNKVFDCEIQQANMNFEFLTTGDGSDPARAPRPELVRAYEKRLSDVEVARKKALAIFADRAIEYEAWRVSSGFGAASDETGRLFQAAYDLEDLIIDFQCRTFEEVILKARFISEYADAVLNEDIAAKVFAQFATIKSDANAPSRLREEAA